MSVANAHQLTAETREQLKAVEEKLFSHPYLAALEAGRIPKERLRLFAGEQYHIISSDLRSVAFLLGRHAHLPSRDYLLGTLQGEAAAWDALLSLAQALEMTEADLQAYEPLPGCQAYPAYVSWLALYGSDADFAAAFLVNLPAWGASCGRMSAALKDQYGFSPDSVAFLDQFAAPPPEFEADSLQAIQDGLDRGLDPQGMRRAARLIQAYELMYWDTLHQASE
jgi:pyrroloquinoline quinone (PQQ) biosynthesis protein C